jgi:Zn-dependent protease with chaperone function
MALQAGFLIGDFVVAATLTWFLNWLALLPYRQLADEHWTERARKLWPVRVGAGSTLWLVPANLVLAQTWLLPEIAPSWGIAAVTSFLGAWTGSYSFHRKLFDWITPRAWLDQLFTSSAFRFGWWFLFLVLISLMPKTFSWETAVLIAVYPIFLAIWSAGGFVWALRFLGVVTPAPDRLRALVDSVALRTNARYRRVWLLKNTGSAAFAIPYTGDLLFSQRLITLQRDQEVAAIAAHELAHLSESRLVQAGRLLGSMAITPCLVLKPVLYRWGPTGILAVFGASWLLFMTARRFSRKLETRADSIGRANEPDAGAYARALAGVHQDNLIPAVMARKTTHPDLYDRLVSIGSTPEYPRPAKPSTFSWQTIVLAVPLGILLGTKAVPLLTSREPAPAYQSEDSFTPDR